MINRSRGVKVGPNFSEVALFFLQFYLINFCFLRAGICRNNQGIADVKEANKQDTGIAAENPKVGIINAKEADKANISNMGIADVKKTDGVDKPGIGTETDDSDTGTATIKEADKVKNLDIGTTDVKKADRINK